MANTNTKSRSIYLVWIVVNDFDKALDFYTKTLGFEIDNRSDEMGWAELRGSSGSMLGIAKQSGFTPFKPGSNAIVTISVDDIEVTSNELKDKGVKLIGKVMEVPGEVKLQMFSDNDGNLFQLAQLLR